MTLESSKWSKGTKWPSGAQLPTETLQGLSWACLLYASRSSFASSYSFQFSEGIAMLLSPIMACQSTIWALQLEYVSSYHHVIAILSSYYHIMTMLSSCYHYMFVIWVCLKIGYIPNYSHLIGIMIINHWVWGYTTFSDTPICFKIHPSNWHIVLLCLQLTLKSFHGLPENPQFHKAVETPCPEPCPEARWSPLQPLPASSVPGASRSPVAPLP